MSERLPPPSPSSAEYHPYYYQFTGVNSCWDVIHLYRLLWASVVLNVIGLFVGIIDAAILGAYKDMVSRSSNNKTTDTERETREVLSEEVLVSHAAHV